jgi:hypothetical protein
MDKLTVQEKECLDWYRTLPTEIQRHVDNLITQRNRGAVLLLFSQQIRHGANSTNRIFASEKCD